MSAMRMRGRKRRYTTDWFRGRDGFTTFGSACAILAACALAFACVWTVRTQSRAAGVQAVADAAALAAQNEVAEFVIAVRVADACLLSMSLTGLALVGAGTACCCVPASAAVGKSLIETGTRILDKRDDVAKTAQKALSAAQDGLPAVAQAQAQIVIRENAGSLGADAVGYVELAPLQGVPVSIGDPAASHDAADAAQDRSDEIAESAAEAQEAREEAQAALEKGYLHDCGNTPGYCMRERADTLAGMPAAQNPMYHSVNTWSFEAALKRAQAYYPYRAATETPAGSGVDEQARSALRTKFYEFAAREVAKGRAVDDGESVPDISFPLLPKNTAEMKQTSLYTDKAYPVAHGCLHAWEGCPGTQRSVEGYGSLAEQDAGAYGVCETCAFDAVSLGKVAAASSSIDNGFEYHYRKVAEAADEYVAALERAVPAESAAKDAVSEVFDRLGDALGELGSCRIEAYPPGRFGALAAIALDMQDEAAVPFVSAAHDAGSYAAISACVLGEDPEEDVLSSLLDGIVDDIGPPLSDAGPAVLSLWASMVKAYSSGTEGFCEGMQGLIDSLPLIGSTGLGSWAAESLMGVLEASGLEPANTEAAKPFVANTEHVAAWGDGPVAEAIASVKGGVAAVCVRVSSERRRLGGLRRVPRRRMPQRLAAVCGPAVSCERRQGQMAVEFAVIMPVIAILAFILLNGLIFAGDCVAFDIAARDAIRLQADDGWEAQAAAEVRSRIEQRLGMEHESVEVTCEKTGAGHIRYTASAAFSPPFLEGASVFGVNVGELRHEVEFTVSPYRKGVVA